MTKRTEQKIGVRIRRNCSPKQRHSRKEKNKEERKEKDAQNSKIDLVENVARIYYS